jgi:hypothetical protein
MIVGGGWLSFDSPRNGSLECDLFFHALGFEHRSVELIRQKLVRAKKTVSFAFETPGILSYDDNARICETHNTQRIPASANARSVVRECLSSMKKSRASVVVDISSLNRRLIAELLLEICASRDLIESFQIVYTPQQYVEPEAGFSKIGPMQAMAPELTAFDSDPDKPIALMLGLGFEYGLGLGLIDLVEPERTVCFKATGFDQRYEDAVKRANFDFQFLTANLLVRSYTLIDPLAAYSELNNVAYGLLSSHRIEIVPLGPKLFTAFAILLSLTFLGQITVLRIPSNMSNPKNAFARDGFVLADVALSALGDVSAIYSVE